MYEAEHLLEMVASVLRLINESSIAPGDTQDFLYALRRRKAPSLAHLTFVATLAGNIRVTENTESFKGRRSELVEILFIHSGLCGLECRDTEFRSF